MAQFDISAQQVRDRHPEQYDRLVKAIEASKSKMPLEPDRDKWKWSYHMAERIESTNFQDLLAGRGKPSKPEVRGKGRALLEQKKDGLFISLDVRAGRRNAYETLDNNALLAGPDESLPLEALGVVKRPEGRSVWVWSDPGQNQAAWREQILDAAVLTPKGTVIRVNAQDKGQRIYLMDPVTRVGREIVDWKGIFDAKELRNLNKTLDRKIQQGDFQLLEEGKFAQMFGSSEGRVLLNARAPSTSELLAALQGPGFMAFGKTPADAKAPPPGNGPWIAFDGNTTTAAPGSASKSPSP